MIRLRLSGAFWRTVRLTMLVLSLTVACVALWQAGRVSMLLKPAATPYTFSPGIRCASFATQAGAQAAYRSDPLRLVRLDGNHNGVACERNPAPYDATPVIWEVRP